MMQACKAARVGNMPVFLLGLSVSTCTARMMLYTMQAVRPALQGAMPLRFALRQSPRQNTYGLCHASSSGT